MTKKHTISKAKKQMFNLLRKNKKGVVFESECEKRSRQLKVLRNIKSFFSNKSKFTSYYKQQIAYQGI